MCKLAQHVLADKAHDSGLTGISKWLNSACQNCCASSGVLNLYTGCCDPASPAVSYVRHTGLAGCRAVLSRHASGRTNFTYHISVLCSLPQTIIQIVPIAETIVDVADSVILLELMNRCCIESTHVLFRSPCETWRAELRTHECNKTVDWFHLQLAGTKGGCSQ